MMNGHRTMSDLDLEDRDLIRALVNYKLADRRIRMGHAGPNDSIWAGGYDTRIDPDGFQVFHGHAQVATKAWCNPLPAGKPSFEQITELADEIEATIRAQDEAF